MFECPVSIVTAAADKKKEGTSRFLGALDNIPQCVRDTTQRGGTHSSTVSLTD